MNTDTPSDATPDTPDSIALTAPPSNKLAQLWEYIANAYITECQYLTEELDYYRERSNRERTALVAIAAVVEHAGGDPR